MGEEDLMKTNGWGEWSKYVLKTLEAQADDLRAIRENMNKIQVDIAMLQVKSGAWGAVGALVIVILARIVKF